MHVNILEVLFVIMQLKREKKAFHKLILLTCMCCSLIQTLWIMIKLNDDNNLLKLHIYLMLFLLCVVFCLCIYMHKILFYRLSFMTRHLYKKWMY